MNWMPFEGFYNALGLTKPADGGFWQSLLADNCDLSDEVYSERSDRIKEQRKGWKVQRRGRMGENVSRFTFREWLLLKEFFGNACLCCGSNSKIVMDHVVPLARGGKDALENLQPLCAKCNSVKGARNSKDYRDPIQLAEFIQITDLG